MNVVNLREKKTEERLEKLCVDCGVEYKGPIFNENIDQRRKALRKLCNAAKRRKKRASMSRNELAEDRAVNASRMQHTRKEREEKEAKSEKQLRLGIEASKKRELRKKQKEKIAMSGYKQDKNKIIHDLYVDQRNPMIKAFNYDIGRTLTNSQGLSNASSSGRKNVPIMKSGTYSSNPQTTLPTDNSMCCKSKLNNDRSKKRKLTEKQQGILAKLKKK